MNSGEHKSAADTPENTGFAFVTISQITACLLWLQAAKLRPGPFHRKNEAQEDKPPPSRVGAGRPGTYRCLQASDSLPTKQGRMNLLS